MRPGLTCYWQIGGRNELSFAEWIKLDLKYIDTWSLMNDLIILLRTIPSVLGARGAR
jgi:lipopolysaccharide/colanic/teichoic acid biosynthesis glycosyltransferase